MFLWEQKMFKWLADKFHPTDHLSDMEDEIYHILNRHFPNMQFRVIVESNLTWDIYMTPEMNGRETELSEIMKSYGYCPSWYIDTNSGGYVLVNE